MTSLGPASFRAYNSVEESAIDYVDFIISNPRYKNVLKSTSIADAANAIAAAGYAPDDPSYAQKIYNIANKSGTLVSSNQGNGSIMNSAAAADIVYKAKQQQSRGGDKTADFSLNDTASEDSKSPDTAFIWQDTPLTERLIGVTHS
jgi:hypothetical protein